MSASSLNHIYRLVWDKVRHVWIAVAETSKGKGNSGRTSKAGGVALINAGVLCLMVGTNTYALPTGGQISAGNGQIFQTNNQLTVNQNSQNLSINWQTFNIANTEKVSFNQPNSSAIVLNRVLGQDPTTILGQLQANGQVFILNPNGVLLGQGAQVNVGGIVASTLNLSDADFLKGNYNFTGNSTASITNNGIINASHGGYVALLGASISNNGTITAPLGNVSLAVGQQVTLQLGNGSLLGLTVDQGAVNALVQNKGVIQANGGQVLLTAKAADTLTQAVVNNSGIIEAQTVGTQNGKISLLGDLNTGTVDVGGTLDASAPAEGNGGQIETSASQVNIIPNAIITAAALQGKAGTWLVDPTDLTIDSTAASTIDNTLNSGTNVIEQTTATTASGIGSQNTNGAGDINIAANLSWSSSATLTLSAYNSININAPITLTGAGGLTLNYNNQQGGSNTAGALNFNSNIQFTDIVAGNTQGKLTINNQAYVLANSLSQLETDITANTGGFYALANNDNASGYTGYIPIGNGTTPFTGVFNGLGNTISNLIINDPGSTYIGLFGVVGAGGKVSNIGMLGGSVTGLNDVGGLVGYNNGGVVSNAFATNSVNGTNFVGGLVGFNGANSTITNSYALGDVTGASTGSFVGGLVGDTGSGSILSVDYASGHVSGGTNVGGLAGYDNLGAISNSYATGNVGGSSNVGGLVGFNNGTVTDTYATGASSIGGGLISNNIGTVSNSYWDYDTSTQKAISGAAGMTSIQLEAALPAGFSNTVWGNANNQTTPYLLTNVGSVFVAGFATTKFTGASTLAQLQNINLTGQYVLVNNINAAGYTGFTPIGNTTTPFAGTFDGLGYTINNLVINQPTTSYVGLFGETSAGVVENLGLIGGSVTGLSDVGGVVGYNNGATIRNVYTTDSVNGTSFVGGLVGFNGGTTDSAISNSYATGAVTGANTGLYVGGLVGNTGTNSILSNDYATGSVSGGTNVGGFIGNDNAGTISNVYATGTVSGISNVGGLAGYNNSGTISDSYATGAVSGSTNVGGLIGHNGGTVTNGYWDTQTSGQSTSAAGIGETTAQLEAALPTGFVNTIWGNINNQTTPYLLANIGSVFVTGGGVIAYTPVTTLAGLQNINLNLAGDYLLANNLNASGLNFIPLGNGATPFTGIFNGLGNIISNLTINDPGATYIGLFGVVGGGGKVSNLGILGGSVTGLSDIGGLIGYNNGGTITNDYATDSVIGTSFIGGLVGFNGGTGSTISNSYATGTVTGTSGSNYVGGLAGNTGTGSSISNDYATGVVHGGTNVGGLLGNNNAGTVSDVYAIGTVSGTTNVGGLVGHNSGTINNGYWDTQTSGQSTSAAGTGETTAQLEATLPAGFSNTVWGNADNQTTPYLVTNTGSDLGGSVLLTGAGTKLYAPVANMTSLENINLNLTGNYLLISSLSASDYAGFTPIGNSSTPFNGVFNGMGNTIDNLTINISTNNIGLFGQVGSGGVIENIGVLGGVMATTGGGAAGGLVGINFGSINNAYATGNVSGNSFIGGLVGENDGSVTNSYAKGNISDNSQGYVGGLVGGNFGSISTSYATGSVSGGGSMGGLVGTNTGILNNVYATGVVTSATASSDVGGLVGNTGTGSSISNAYATGSVRGTGDIGGLVGRNIGSISNVYATGAVSGSGAVGGLVGVNLSTVSDGYWDTQTSGQSSSSGGTGETTAQLEATLPAGFSNTIWGISAGTGFPYLLNLPH